MIEKDRRKHLECGNILFFYVGDGCMNAILVITHCCKFFVHFCICGFYFIIKHSLKVKHFYKLSFLLG